MERVARIELANKPWQGFRLPLHHTRINGAEDCFAQITQEGILYRTITPRTFK